MSLNAYVYALSNPLSWIDPLGLSPVDASPMMAPSSEVKINASFLGGFAKGFVKTAAAAAVGIVAAAAAPLATAVVGSGLAVYGTVSNYRQRAAEQVAAGQKVNKVGTFFAALGDTLGVSGLIEGITGKRMLTGQKLSPAQAGEKLGGGVASVAAMVAGPALVKTIRPVVSKIVEPVRTAVASAATSVRSVVSSFFSKIGAGIRGLAADEAGGWRSGSEPVGPRKPMVYENAPYHYATPAGAKSPAPTNGQDVLDNSVLIKPTSPSRIGIDPKTGEIVAFSRHLSTPTEDVYHGYVRPWQDLTGEMRSQLIKSGMTTRSGRILK